MNKNAVCGLGFIVYSLLASFVLSGCTVRTYSVKKDRVDQEVAGNQGFLAGSAPKDYQSEKKFSQRETKVVEIEFRNPIKFEKVKALPEKTKADTTIEGNKGYIREGGTEETISLPSPSQETEATPTTETYIVQKDDTLQKISAKIYGTTKKWMKIYEANKDNLKAPDRIYPGQKLRIPQD